MNCSHTRGAALVDVVFTCGLIALLAAVALPSLQASRERDAAVLAARYLASKLNLLRIEAVRRNRVVAMRFDPDDVGGFRSYIDGDGDGVRQNDVDSRIDLPFDSSAHLSEFFATVALAVPRTIPAPDGDGVIAANSDPLRIGNSNFISFTPLGASTSGTVYLAGRDGTQVAIRLFGATGRVRVLRYDRGNGAWRED